MSNYARPTYADGYEIRYNRASDQFECWQNDTLLSKKDGKPASYKALGLAIKFMTASGAQEAVPPKKTWTRPEAVEIAPLEEQLAALPPGAPRFVVIEKHISIYGERGYGVYDRETQELICPHTYHGINFLSYNREDAENEAAYRQEHPPVNIEPDMALASMLVDMADAYEHRFSNPLPEPTPPPARQELVFVTEEKHQVGDVLTDSHGRTYQVTKPSYLLSDRDVADMEDQDIFGVQAGWQTEAKITEEEA